MASIIDKTREAFGQSDALYNEWASFLGINSNHLFVLYALAHQTGVTQKQLATYTGLPKQTVNNVVRAFITDGIVTFSSANSDRREKTIDLTEKGRCYADRVLSELRQLEERVFTLMGEERVRQMLDALTLFNTLFEKEMKDRKDKHGRDGK